MPDPTSTIRNATHHQTIDFQDAPPPEYTSGRRPGATASQPAVTAPQDSFENIPAPPPRVRTQTRPMTGATAGAIREDIERGNARERATRRENLGSAIAEIDRTPRPASTAIRLRALMQRADVDALRERQQDAVIHHPTHGTEAVVTAGELVVTAGEGLTHGEVPADMPVAVVANTIRSTLDGDARVAAERRLASDTARAEQLRAQARQSTDQGRADATRADFTTGPRPAQINWSRIGTDADYAQAVRDGLRRRQIEERY